MGNGPSKYGGNPMKTHLLAQGAAGMAALLLLVSGAHRPAAQALNAAGSTVRSLLYAPLPPAVVELDTQALSDVRTASR